MWARWSGGKITYFVSAVYYRAQHFLNNVKRSVSLLNILNGNGFLMVDIMYIVWLYDNVNFVEEVLEGVQKAGRGYLGNENEVIHICVSVSHDLLQLGGWACGEEAAEYTF